MSVRNINEQRGFTFIELLVVLLIIGIMLGLTTLNFNRNLDNITHNEAKHFIRVVSYVKEYAAYSGRILSLRFNKPENQYYFLYVDPITQKWNKFDAKNINNLLSEHSINSNVSIKIKKRKSKGDDLDVTKNSIADFEIALISPFSEFKIQDVEFIGESKNYVVSHDEFDKIILDIKQKETTQ